MRFSWLCARLRDGHGFVCVQQQFKLKYTTMPCRTCVLSTVHFLGLIGRMFGMVTFTLDRGENKGIRVTFFDVMLLIGFLVYYIGLLTLNYTNKIEFLDGSFTIFNTGIRYLLIYAITMVIFTVCFNFLFRNKLWSILMKVLDVDEEVRHIFRSLSWPLSEVRFLFHYRCT